jgi:hypothetical protein
MVTIYTATVNVKNLRILLTKTVLTGFISFSEQVVVTFPHSIWLMQWKEISQFNLRVAWYTGCWPL